MSEIGDLIKKIIKILGVPGTMLFFTIVVSLIWIFAHIFSPPCGRISVFFGLVEYTKSADTPTGCLTNEELHAEIKRLKDALALLASPPSALGGELRPLVKKKRNEAFKALEKLCFDESAWVKGASRRCKKDFSALLFGLGGASDDIKYERITERLREKITTLNEQIKEVEFDLKTKTLESESIIDAPSGAENYADQAKKMVDGYTNYIEICATKNFLNNDKKHLNLLNNLLFDAQQFKKQRKSIDHFIEHMKKTMQINT